MGFYEDEEMWEKNWDKSVENLLKNYKKAFDEVLVELFALIGMENSEMNAKKQKEILLMLTRIISELEKENEEWVLDEIAKVFLLGQAAAVLQLGLAKNLNQAKKVIVTSQYKRQVLDSIMADTMEDLLAATQNTDKRTKKIVRDVFAEVMRQQRIQDKGRKTIEKEIGQILTKKLLEEQVKKDGFVGVIDASNRKWELSKYISMTVRTKMIESYRQGAIAECIERGIDTVFISTHGAEDACKRFEGLVLSLTGATKGIPKLDDLRRYFNKEIFHPNCSHKLRPIRKLENLPPNIQKLNDKNLKNVKELL